MKPHFATPFIYSTRATRIVFGAGSLERLGNELDELGIRRALVLCTPEQRELAERVRAIGGARCHAIFDGAVMHVPVETAEAGVRAAKEHGADGLVAAGGGSTLGLAKAIALETSLPIVAIPTTYAGSEVTSIYGLTAGSEKKTGKSHRVLPRTAIYDATLTLTLPVALSATSGLNAIAHAAEGLYAQDGNPVMSMFAEEGIRSLAQGLPFVCAQPKDIEAREVTQYGAWLCGTVLGNVGMALHHKLCHTLGGTLNLPHAETHAVILPYAMAFNLPAVPDARARLSRALDTDDPAVALYELGRKLAVPASLAELGVSESDLDRVAEFAMRSPYFNPRPLSLQSVRTLLQMAFEGDTPISSAFLRN
ncbi:maleylacetate reductase [Caballeronia sordidicola]|uniref:maleylacetate reductase n=1 Tax=Caballeronia sordidicola TaxID=196367 RepID=UPI0004CFF95A|nr:maleylacetate reductase [Caballeronia sordidicola]